ncbi:MAG TPA: GntR family transcriptional regulator [Vicinamibacterales bacterium]|nr:GntR family transcriptional regulator [Vicinamibacterales bacterium]
MLLDIDPHDPRPVYRQIVDEIQRSVAVGVLRADEPLPAAAALAADLKVNINTVQHAYRTLAQEGTAYVKRGVGTFVSPPPKENRQRQAVAARRIAEKMLREGFRHGLLASDLIAALQEIAPRRRDR